MPATPVDVLRWTGTTSEPTGEKTWPRTFRFAPMYDPSVPEDVRYAKASPSGELRLQVDNPNVAFQPGRDYYLDFTPVDSTEA